MGDRLGNSGGGSGPLDGLSGLAPHLETLAAQVAAVEGGGSFSSDHVTRLKRDFESFQADMDELSAQRAEEAVGHLKSSLLLLQLLTLEHTDLYLVLSEHVFDDGALARLGIKEGSREKKQLLQFTFILSNQISCLLAARRLVLAGLGLPLQATVRAYIEHSDLGIAVLSDPDFFDAFSQDRESPEDSKRIWYSTYRKKHLDKIVRRAYRDFYPPDPLFDELHQQNKDAYGWLSTHLHGDYMSNLVGAMGAPLGDEDTLGPTIGGRITTWTRDDLRTLLLMAFRSVGFSVAMIVQHLGLPFAKFGESGEYHVTLHLLSRTLFRAMIKEVFGTERNPRGSE